MDDDDGAKVSVEEGAGEVAVHEPGESLVVQRRARRWPRRFGWALLGLLAIIGIVGAILWSQRRSIASDELARQLNKRGVQATYRLDRVGLRTQQISNLVIGDPRRPDLTARVARIEMRIRWNGTVEVYRVVARGVRLNGRLVGNRVTWGQVDKLLPVPKNDDKPFRFPDISVDLADSSIALETPFGPLGLAVEGSGNLTGGFKGRLAAVSPRLAPGRCELVGMRAAVGVSISARQPRVIGPISAERLSCPSSQLALAAPRIDLNTVFSEAFGSFEGKGRLTANSLQAGVNGLAALNGRLTFGGSPTQARGEFAVSADQARMAQIVAQRTRIGGRYALNARKGELALVAEYAAQGATLAPSLTAGFVTPLMGMAGTPLEPLATNLARALQGATRDLDASGRLRLVNAAGGGAVRIETADVRSRTGARIRVAGDDGVTYYWPSGRIRIDSGIDAAGGGLPTAHVALRQPRDGSPMSGLVEMAPYAAGGARLALAPVLFAAQRDGSTSIATRAVLDGPISGGQVTGLSVPLEGRFGPNGALEFGRGCVPLQFASLKLGGLQLGQTSIPVCAPGGGAILFRKPGGGLAIRAGTRNLALDGRLGNSPFRLRSANAALVGSRAFTLDGVAAQLGKPQTPVLLNARQIEGTFKGSGISGLFRGGDGTIGRVPLQISQAEGKWLFYKSRLTVDGGVTVADRFQPARFYPLRSPDMHFALGGDNIRATGTLRQPGSNVRVANVVLAHRLSSGEGNAQLDVPQLTFGPGLQPEQLTRLTEGVIALVRGSVSGRGRINWHGDGKVDSTGDFSTENTDLAAAFGPVTGLKGTIHFTDLLGLQSAPGQVIDVASVNTGIVVNAGQIRYQLLPGQLVRIEQGRWPFMGGELILQETLLNLGKPTAKRLTFEVRGLDANQFVTSFEFKEIGATGTFDGVLPMIFDDQGGRIVGGRLDSREPGGSLKYNGVVNRANLGLFSGLAFDALRDLRFKSMIIRLDGDLAGEFATRLTVDQVALGNTTKFQRILKSVTKIPFKFNVTIRGPFRALISTAKSMRDPRNTVDSVLDRPLQGSPDVSTEVRSSPQATTQTQTPVKDEVTISATPEPDPATPPPARKTPARK
jgi:translocation and assembly module TamB